MWGSCRIRQRTASENASVGEVSRGAERIERTGGTHHARFESSHVHEEATAVDAARAAVLRRHPSDVMLHVVRDMFDALVVAAPFRVPLAHDAQRNRHTLPRAPPLGERWASVRRVQRPAREQSRWLLFILPFLACWRWKAFVFVAVQAAGRESFRRLSRAVCRDCECARCVGISLYCPTPKPQNEPSGSGMFARRFGHAKADWPIVDPRLVWPQCECAITTQ